ncbi:MAG: hypothetical protein GTN75_01660, partial [Gemmatimonadetes bacterium]|nr:hypothetical protein [Gemmatimonadota bacterium]
MTADERRELANTISDRVGHAILSRPEDPTYASVSKFHPPMKFPREVVGVPEHPLDIGVDYFGRLDVGPWAPPIAWFEIGDRKVPFAGDPPPADTTDWWRGDVKSPSAFERTPIKRRLLDGYLPVITLSTEHDRVQCELTVYGWSDGFSPEKPLHAFCRM